MSRVTLRQRRALRSAAAVKGWETRIARERREIEAMADHPGLTVDQALVKAAELEAGPWAASFPGNAKTMAPLGYIPGRWEVPPDPPRDPNPWPHLVAKVRAVCARVAAWLRR